MGASYAFSVPPEKFAPIVSQYLGRMAYLTCQTNHLVTLYYAVVVLDAVRPSAATNKVVLKLFPLVFALGFFLTIAYYLLDHSNPENQKKKDYW